VFFWGMGKNKVFWMVFGELNPEALGRKLKAFAA
jgi:hypothetical protein